MGMNGYSFWKKVGQVSMGKVPAQEVSCKISSSSATNLPASPKCTRQN